jgi:putative membrane protein
MTVTPLIFAALLQAQDPNVELRQRNRLTRRRTVVQSDGRYESRNIPAGYYNLQIGFRNLSDHKLLRIFKKIYKGLLFCKYLCYKQGMRFPRQFSILATTAVLAVVCASAQTNSQPNDPYNPQTRRLQNNTIEPTLADMGSGFDEGNIGPFVTMTDKQYAQAMALRGMMEIRLGQTARDKTDRADVKAVAERMIKDYLNWNDGMVKAAKKLRIELPSDLDSKQKGVLDRISALSGPAFDQAYLREVIHLQTTALTMSHLEATEAGVSGFRHWAGITIPEIQDQIQLAQKAFDVSTVSKK